MNRLAMWLGYGVALLWLLGALGVGHFSLRFGPAAPSAGKTESCQSSSGFLGGKKWMCTPEEKAALAKQQAGR